jgi:hypothetical protein
MGLGGEPSMGGKPDKPRFESVMAGTSDAITGMDDPDVQAATQAIDKMIKEYQQNSTPEAKIILKYGAEDSDGKRAMHCVLELDGREYPVHAGTEIPSTALDFDQAHTVEWYFKKRMRDIGKSPLVDYSGE